MNLAEDGLFVEMVSIGPKPRGLEAGAWYTDIVRVLHFSSGAVPFMMLFFELLCGGERIINDTLLVADVKTTLYDPIWEPFGRYPVNCLGSFILRAQLSQTVF